MKNIYLLLSLITAIFISCEKREISEKVSFESNSYPNAVKKKLKEYNLLDEIDLYTAFNETSEGTILFSGLKEKKLHLKEFNQTNKKNIWTFVSKVDIADDEMNIITSNGETIEAKFERVATTRHTYEQGIVLILHTYYIHIDHFLVLSNMLFITDNNEKVIDVNTTDIINENDFLISINVVDWHEHILFVNLGGNKTGFYDHNGDLLYEVDDRIVPTKEQIEKNLIYHLNADEFLSIEQNIIKRYNLKTNSEAWASKKIDSIPDNAQINNSKFEAIDSDFTKCTINYTLSQGDKKSIAIKVNNENGEFTEI